MERLLHSAWKHRLYNPTDIRTTNGKTIEIIDPGIYNTDAGPDFFNAKVKIDDKVWAGNVEIHTSSSDWYKHRHELNKAYNSVILHVVQYADCQEVFDANGRSIPQWAMRIPDKLADNYQYLLSRGSEAICLDRLHLVDPIYLSDWKHALLTERLERKTGTIFQWLDHYQNDWNEVFYITLARNFGFGTNSDAFEWLAKRLPLKCISKHSDSVVQTEALFLGQAGLLESIRPTDEYHETLIREYRFLRQKYNLQPLSAEVFKSLRIRPFNFPHIKVVQLADLIRNHKALFSHMLSMENSKDYATLFVCEVSDYWKSHYRFGQISAGKAKHLGNSAIQVILINTVAPILFAYGKKKNSEIHTERGIRLLEEIPAEKNYITALFSEKINCTNAADSQALIQLKKEYCDKKKCMFCRIGFKLLTK